MINQLLSDSVQSVLDGNTSALEAYGYFKEVEKHLAKCIAEIESGAMLEAETYKGQTFKGYEVSVRSGYAQYNYEANEGYKEMKDRLKTLEDRLKIAAKNNMAYIDAESGEVFEPVPIKGYTKDSIILKVCK